MQDNASETRDLIGDQIGWSARQLMPPTPELRKLDRAFMKALPLNLRRTVALFRFNKGWLPEIGNPDEAYYGMLTVFCRQYLTDFGQKYGINTLLVPTSGNPLKIQPEDFPKDTKEKTLRWDKQVEWANKWANKIREHKETGEDINIDNLKEAEVILYIQGEMTNFFESLKTQFIKRGLRFPWLPKEIKSGKEK